MKMQRCGNDYYAKMKKLYQNDCPSLPCSTGTVEGRISKLKTMGRTMNGRGGFDMLHHRVLKAA